MDQRKAKSNKSSLAAKRPSLLKFSPYLVKSQPAQPRVYPSNWSFFEDQEEAYMVRSLFHSEGFLQCFVSPFTYPLFDFLLSRRWMISSEREWLTIPGKEAGLSILVDETRVGALPMWDLASTNVITSLTFWKKFLDKLTSIPQEGKIRAISYHSSKTKILLEPLNTREMTKLHFGIHQIWISLQLESGSASTVVLGSMSSILTVLLVRRYVWVELA